MDKKYKIEGNIDFFSELYKSLDQEDDNNDDNKCLITNQLLVDRFVKLNCGHSFNYLPLLHDIKNHKDKFNNLEGCHTKLKYNELRCPYCRKRQNELLPYYYDLYPDKINGVNCIIPFLNYSVYHQADYLFGDCCFKMDDGTNSCIIKKVYNFDDGKTYCFTHCKIMTKQLIKDIGIKKKEDAKQGKLKEKEDAKQAKLKEKEDAKQAKLNEKKNNTKNKKNKIAEIIDLVEQNEIVGQNEIVEQNEIISEHIGCVEILQCGANKGNKCGKSIFNNNLCKRHSGKKLNTETI